MINNIIIGASKEGIAVYNKLKDNYNTLLISRTVSTKLKSDKNVLQDDLLFVAYWRGLLQVTLKSGAVYLCNRIIIATGTKSILQANTVAHIADLPKLNKKSSIITVFGKNEEAINNAIALSKKCKQVYLCIDSMPNDDPIWKLLEDINNIIIMPNSTLADITPIDNKYKVTLSTYSTIICQAVILNTKRIPEVPANLVNARIINQSELTTGITVNDDGTLPSLGYLAYAIGGCTAEYNTNMFTKKVEALVNTIIADTKMKGEI